MFDDGPQFTVGYLEWEGLDSELVPLEHAGIDLVLKFNDVLIGLRSRRHAS